MLLQEIIQLPVLATQTTITQNMERTTKENEAAAQEAYVRQRINKIAYLYFLSCNPFIV
ncbi:MAG: hypothetical protein JSS10_07170 [Verrucomicrobia bacterium]|nr:hypothetical protein [Verrucomicrobiota bacterium]